jgi:hypothetical protein
VSICTQFFVTILGKHDELLVRLNVRSICSRAGIAVHVPVSWMTANLVFTLLVCFQAITLNELLVYPTLHSAILINNI